MVVKWGYSSHFYSCDAQCNLDKCFYQIIPSVKYAQFTAHDEQKNEYLSVGLLELLE